MLKRLFNPKLIKKTLYKKHKLGMDNYFGYNEILNFCSKLRDIICFTQ